MIPILYDSMTEGTVPSHYGLGALSDCLRCEVTEERNGSYELSLDYTANGLHASDIAVNRFIMAKPNFTDDPQIFRIYKIGKMINGQFTVNAQHISYDLSGKIIQNGVANSCVAACSLLQGQAGSFTINTDRSISRDFNITAPSSVRSWFGGKEGSILDIYGSKTNGEWKYDNYTCSFKNVRGSDRGVTIRYGKNLTDLNQVLDMSNLCTGVLPFYIDQDGNKTIGTKISTGLVSDVPRDLAVDFSDSINPDSVTPISTQLTALAGNYIARNNLNNPLNNITLNFVQLSNLQERVDLCDTVHIYFESLGISASAKCIATTWDVLQERYTSTTFGNPKTNIADTIAVTQREASEAVNRSSMDIAIAHATDLITGNLGGYVIMHDSNNDGTPDEILIMNTADINTATKVWRWNKSGLGYSDNGYSGPFGLAMTADGEIVADYITTGTLDADLIKAGTIEDLQGNSSIDMTNGSAKMKDFKAIGSFDLIDPNNNVKAELLNRVGDSTHFILYDESGTLNVFLGSSSSGVGLGGYESIHNSNGQTVIYLYCSSGGHGSVIVSGASGNDGVGIAADQYGGTITVKDSLETNNISLTGNSGQIVCVSLVQTSSRKVKKNIKPIKDPEKILELEAVSFDYKNEARGTNKHGFIAEDVAEVLPDLVTPETEGTPASLDYIQMIPYLQAVIKEQEKRIKALEDKLNGIN